MNDAPFYPGDVLAPGTSTQPVPRVFASPSRYIQGPGTITALGRYLALLNGRRAGILASRRGLGAEASMVVDSLRHHAIDSVTSVFPGECSLAAIEAATAELVKAKIDVLVAVGGGKCVDAGKSVASRLGVPVVVVPTLASNDAPCSALSVIYSDEGVTAGIEFSPLSPALVVVDTAVVAAASERYLAAGMGDAMATWYEARVCLDNPAARNTLGGRPTVASCALGERCAHIVYEDGLAAGRAVLENRVDESLERIVEANTLLSGVGFESGGVAAAHAVAQGYTLIPAVEDAFLHGELVAMGTLVQLAMLEDEAEARRVGTFFAQVGLPICLDQLGLGVESPELDGLVEGSLGMDFIHNMPMPVDAALVRDAIRAADRLGEDLRAAQGDRAYRRLQGG